MAEPKVIVVLPAYNAGLTLESTVRDIPINSVNEVILVDDGSKDNTAELAERLGLTVFRHDKNRGYGGNQKTCYDMALKKNADIVVMLHPDYQYDPRLVKYFVDFIKEGHVDVMLGSRIRSRKEALAGGMPLYKYLANRILTFIENIASGQVLSEWHTGMRAYTKEVLQKVDYHNNSDDFLFDTQMLFRIIESGFRIGELPVPVRYRPDSSSISFNRSIKYGLGTIREVLHHLARKLSG